MLKPKCFEIKGSLLIEQHITKDGPSPYFVVWVPHTARMFYDRKAMMRFIKWPKGTPSREKIDEWLSSLDAPKAPALDMDAIKREGFGPEADGLDETDPNHQTKMVT